MLIPESVLRSVVREAILKEQTTGSVLLSVLVGDIKANPQKYLSSKRGKLETITWKGKKYKALGFLEKGNPVALIKKSDLKPQDASTSGPFQLLGQDKVTLINADDKRVYNLAQYKGGDSVPVSVRDSAKDVKINIVKVDYGDASSADVAVEIGAILGAIPGIGAPADIATGILAAIKDPPDYLIAAFSIICAAPVVGLGAAFARSAVKKAGSGGVKKVGKLLGRQLQDKGVKLSTTKLSKIKQSINSVWKSMTSEQRIKQITELTNMEAAQITARLGETKKYVDEILDNVEVLGSGARGVDELSMAIVKKTSAKLLTEITSGQIRNVCVRWSKDLAKQLPKIAPNPPKGLIGRSFKHPSTGKDIIFTSFKEFREEFLRVADLLDHPNGQDIFMKYYGKIAQTPLPVQPANIETVIDMLMQKMSKIKIEIVTDPKVAAKAFGKNTRGLMRHGDPPKVLINFNKFSRDGLEKNIQETMEHELIHGIDKLLLTVLAGGDKLAEDLIKRKGIVMASDIAATSGVLKGAAGSQLSDYVFSPKKVRQILDANKRNLDGLTNWQYYLARVGKLDAGDLAYVSNPAEMFVRIQRISYWLKQNGFPPNKWDEFFRRDANEIIDEVPDADFFDSFFPLFKKVYGENATGFQKTVVNDLYAMFDALI